MSTRTGVLLLWLLAGSVLTASAATVAAKPATAAATDPATVESEEEVDSAAALKATLNAIEAAVAFMKDHSERVNLDGVIGLRTVEGQTGALLARYWTRLPVWLVGRLTHLRDLSGSASRLAVQAVRRQTPVYYKNAGDMIQEHFWDTYYPTRPLPPPPPPPQMASEAKKEGGDFDEKFSDDCIHEFYGQEGKPATTCAVSERCWRRLVLPRGMSGYSLTHQLFYLMNGVQANCLSNLTAMADAHPPTDADGSLASVFDGLCSRIVGDAERLEAAGFPMSDRDLFMEQVGICGLAGYPEAARWRWLPVILSWQRPTSGCFGQFSGELIDPRNFQPSRYGNYRRRRKRAEARMSDSCLSHRTSVALDALVAFGRRIIEEAFV